jgi:hypothetical protein
MAGASRPKRPPENCAFNSGEKPALRVHSSVPGFDAALFSGISYVNFRYLLAMREERFGP